LDALKDLSSPRTLVIHDGHRIVLPSLVVVPGDVVVLGEGVLRPNLEQAA
jgi:Ca2+-transporting ATPase